MVRSWDSHDTESILESRYVANMSGLFRYRNSRVHWNVHPRLPQPLAAHDWGTNGTMVPSGT